MKRNDEEEHQKNVNLLIANGFLKAGAFAEAREIYEKEGVEIPKDNLIECGNVCAVNGLLDEARRAYKTAGVDIPDAKLIECGDACFKASNFPDASISYFLAKDEAKLIACGDDCIRRSIIAKELPKNSVIRGGVHPKSEAMKEFEGTKEEIRKEFYKNALEFYRAAARISAK